MPDSPTPGYNQAPPGYQPPGYQQGGYEGGGYSPPGYQGASYPPSGYGGYQQPPSYGYGGGYAQPGRTDPFGRPLAGWWQRVGALLLDSLIIGIPAYIVALVITSHSAGGSSVLVTELVVGIGELLYFAILDGNSQSVGKRALGIAVRSEATGQPIGFGAALARWLIWVVLWWILYIPGLLDALSPLWDSKNQAWHDHAVGSLVVQVR